MRFSMSIVTFLQSLLGGTEKKIKYSSHREVRKKNARTELLASWQNDILDAFLHPSWVTFIFPADEITSALYLELLQDLT